ncbi:MAG: MFS transporter [Isosphaeraceae bacterium]
MTLDHDAPAKTGRPLYPWVVVGLLWICGFLNYADRQAVFSVFALLGEEFQLDDVAKGMIGSSFMWVYALSAPFAGYIVDRTSRRRLISVGLGVWSLVCAATGTASSYIQLLFYRAAEGLGESFYFPASMSLLAEYHGPSTRSKAMGLHQTSVYAGTAVGGILAGYLGMRYGWRMPFYVLGGVGIAYAMLLPWVILEPSRASVDPEAPPPPDVPVAGIVEQILSVLRIPAALALLLAFAGANSVAATLLTWLPDFVKRTHGLDLLRAATVAGLYFPISNAVGALFGGALADAIARRVKGGRVLVQATGLFLGAPCVWIAGTTTSLNVLIVALIGIGLSKGIYDANIFASVFDVVQPKVRGTAAGLMNTGGWALGAAAPTFVGWLSERYGLGFAIGSTAGFYLGAGCLALLAARLTARTPKLAD